MKKVLISIFVIISILSSSSSFDPCVQKLVKVTILKELGESATDFRKKYCKTDIGVSETYKQDYKNFVIQAREEFKQNINKSKFDYDEIHKKIMYYMEKTKEQPMIDLHYDLELDKTTFTIAGEVFYFKEDMTKDDDFLEEYVKIFNYMLNTMASKSALETYQGLVKLDRKWDRYFQESRSQAFYELWINSKLYKQIEFTSPPDWQVIFMHPNIVIEHVPDAQDGQNTKEALLVELIGVNRWKNENWYIPTGASVVSTYSDRAITDDIGFGVMVHFVNTFSIGYTKYGNRDGVFLSFDLGKFFQDKKNLFSAYSKRVKSLRLGTKEL